MLPDASSLLSSSRKRTRAVFGDEYLAGIEVDDEQRYGCSKSYGLSTDNSHRARISSKIRSEYENVKELPFFLAEKQGKARKPPPKTNEANGTIQTKLIEDVQRSHRYRMRFGLELIKSERGETSNALTVRMPTSRPRQTGATPSISGSQPSTSLIRRENYQPIKPEWHAPWKLRTVIRYVFHSFPR